MVWGCAVQSGGVWGEEEEENICVHCSGAPRCSSQIFLVAPSLLCALSQQNPSLQDVVDTEHLGGDQVLAEVALT